MKGTRLLDGYSQVDEHRGRLVIRGRGVRRVNSLCSVSDVFSSFQ